MFKRIFTSITAVILMIALACGMVACDATYEPSEETYKQAFAKQCEAISSGIDEYYDLMEERSLNNMSVNATMSVNLSKDLLSLLETEAGMELDWINKVTYTVSESFKEEVMSMAASLAYDGKTIISGQSIMNLAKGIAYIGVPELNDKFLKVDLEDVGMTGTVKNAFLETLLTMDVMEVLPDKDALKGLVTTVLMTIVDNLEGVDFDESTIEVNGVEQECVEYVLELSPQDLANMGIAVLEAIQDSEDFETIVADLMDYVTDMAKDFGLSSSEIPDEDEVFEMLDEALDEAIDGLKSMKSSLPKNDMIVLTSYITNKLEILGMEIVVKGVVAGEDVTAFFGTATNEEGEIGSEISVTAGETKYVEIIGDLKEEDGKISGDYDVKYNGSSLIVIELEDVDSGKLDEGYLVGSFTIAPSNGLMDLLGSEAAMIAGFSLKFDVEECDMENLKATVSVMNGKVNFASITFDAEMGEGEKVDTPKNTEKDPEEWISDFDMDKVIKTAKDNDAPKELIELLEMLEEEIG